MSPLRFLAIVAATMLILACATWALGPVAALGGLAGRMIDQGGAE